MNELLDLVTDAQKNGWSSTSDVPLERILNRHDNPGSAWSVTGNRDRRFPAGAANRRGIWQCVANHTLPADSGQDRQPAEPRATFANVTPLNLTPRLIPLDQPVSLRQAPAPRGYTAPGLRRNCHGVL